MYLKCALCAEASGPMEVVVVSMESVNKAPFLLLEDKVVFDPAKIDKFASFCAAKGVSLKKTQVLDMCENCLKVARVQLN